MYSRMLAVTGWRRNGWSKSDRGPRIRVRRPPRKDLSADFVIHFARFQFFIVIKRLSVHPQPFQTETTL